MGMIISGGSRSGAGQMAAYALAQGGNEVSEIVEVNHRRGGDAASVKAAFKEMEAVAKGTRCEKFLYHAQINPEKEERLTPKQWGQAVELLEKDLKLAGHSRVVWRDVKEGREHYHVAWSRIDPESMKAVNMGHDYRAHERAAAKMEKDFGLAVVERRPNLEKAQRQERAPKDWEYQQSARNGLDPRTMRGVVTQLKEQALNKEQFIASLSGMGFTLARGDKAPFFLVDETGGTHNLRQCLGMKQGELALYMDGVDRAALPTIAGAKKEAKENLVSWISGLKQESKDGPEFADKLKESGFILAQGDKRDFVVVDKGGGFHNLARYSGTKAADLRGFMADVDREALPTVQDAREEAKAAQAVKADAMGFKEEPKEERKKEAREEKKEAQAGGQGESLGMGHAAGRVADVAVSAVDKAFDFLMGTIDGLLCAPAPREYTAQECLRNVEARQARAQQQAEAAAKEERRAGHIQDLKGGKILNGDMLPDLNKKDLETLKTQGIYLGVNEIVRRQEEQQELEREQENQRQRRRERY